MDPQEYFDYIKSKKNEMSDELLDQFEETINSELSKAMITGQNFMIKRLAFTVGTILREKELVKRGFTTYVLREDIEEYINTVAEETVKITDLATYPRSIPNEIASQLMRLKEDKLFDNYYVVFTDYTDEVGKQIEKERIKKDPILFGTFETKIDGIWDIHDRFYFIGDWEDEYCDLTLAKMVEEMSKKKPIEQQVALPVFSSEEIRSFVNRLQEEENDRFRLKPKKKTFFEKVRSIIGSNR